jgi:ribosomal protein L21
LAELNKFVLGAFDTHIEYLLIVATALQIIPIGLSLTKPTQLGEQSILTMIAVNLAVPSDDITMSSIIGTDDGRLFLVGHPTMDQSNVTGDVYELTYTVMKLKIRKKKNENDNLFYLIVFNKVVEWFRGIDLQNSKNDQPILAYTI